VTGVRTVVCAKPDERQAEDRTNGAVREKHSDVNGQDMSKIVKTKNKEKSHTQRLRSKKTSSEKRNRPLASIKKTWSQIENNGVLLSGAVSIARDNSAEWEKGKAENRAWKEAKLREAPQRVV